MIQAGVLGSSIMPGMWDSDIFQDYSTRGLLDSDYDLDGGDRLSGYSTPVESCSSDYDGLVFDEFDNYFPISDSFVSEILDNSSSFTELDLLTYSDSSPKDSHLNNYNPSANVQKNATDYLQSTKLWSHMSPDEQYNTLHALSNLVTYKMGIREQMEVIKIIDPTAIISPDVKEFALDVTNINDVKLQQVKDLILRLKPQLQKSSKSLNSFSSLSSKKSNNSSQKLLSRKNNSYTRTKRTQKRQQESLSEEILTQKQKRLKLQKQTRKEKKSGFFVYEKKMVLNSVPDDEEINILE